MQKLNHLKKLQEIKFYITQLTENIIFLNPEDITAIKHKLKKLNIQLNYNNNNLKYTEELEQLNEITETQIYKITTLINDSDNIHKLNILYQLENKLKWINQYEDYTDLQELSIYLWGWINGHNQKIYDAKMIKIYNNYHELYKLVKNTLNNEINETINNIQK